MTPAGEPEGDAIPDEAIRAEMVKGNKIEALRLFRLKHGVGLAEAKYGVEALLAQDRGAAQRHAGSPPPEAPWPRDLWETGYDLADEIRDGKWRHVKDIDYCPARDCPEIFAEFRRRCPGHTPEEMRSALGKGFEDSR